MENLPSELWLLILDYVEWFPETDVFAMARCSHFFYDALVPRLFRTVTLKTTDSLRNFERLVLGEQKPRWERFTALLRRRKEQHGSGAEDRVPALHQVRNLAIPFKQLVEHSKGEDFGSVTRRILAACPNTDTVFFDLSLDTTIGLLHDYPQITRLFVADDHVLNDPILTHRGSGFHNLTHLWINDLRRFWSAVSWHMGSTVDPDAFPVLTHVVAGSDLDIKDCEDMIATAVSETLRLTSLQRFLFLIPRPVGSPRVAEATPVWHTLAALQDPRVYAMITLYGHGSSSASISMWRWAGLTGNQRHSNEFTWESGIQVWDASHDKTAANRDDALQ